MVPSSTSEKIRAEIAALGDFSRSDLAERWQQAFKLPPPKGMRRPLMIRALAYQLQAKRWGGLRRETARRLQGLAAGDKPQSRPASGKRATDAKAGLRLYREWNSKTHVVEVREDGVHWNGDRYGSLSAVARAITGARWSGPRFFGLKGSGAS